MSFNTRLPNSQGSSLRNTLITSERKKPIFKPQLNSTPSEVDVISMMSQAKLDRRPVVLPCMPPDCVSVLQIWVTHNPITDNFDWSIYVPNGDQMDLFWGATNPPVSMVAGYVRDAGKVLNGREQTRPLTGEVAAPMIGEFLVSNGVITHNTLVSALSLQKTARLGPRPLGEILSLSGAINSRVLEVAVALQSMIKRDGVNKVSAGEMLKKSHVNGWSLTEVLQNMPTSRY